MSYNSILREGNYVAGNWANEGTGAHNEVKNKYDKKLIASLPMASKAQMENAIDSAQKAFSELRGWSAGKRSKKLLQLAKLLEDQQEQFVDLLIAEAGKPRSYAESELNRSLITIRTAASEILRFGGEHVPIDFSNGEGKTAFTKPFPIGPIACITPFNFPINLVLHKLAPALALGNPVVLKPAPQAPLSALALAGLIDELGYPAGSLNVLNCSNEVAETMVKDDRLKMLSFTGSDKVGWYLKSIAGKKRVALELGGNASVIVDESADLPKTAKLLATGAFLYSGQICISTQRIFVVKKVFKELTSILLDEISKLKLGDPSDADITVGPIIDSGHIDRINEWVQEAKDAGAEILCGGTIHNKDHNTFRPTLLTNTRSEMKVCSNEVFGPVAVIEKVKDFKEAIDKTNDSRYGLQVGVFTNKVNHFKMAHEELEVGGIIINNIPGFRIDSMPYGGVKDSGLGREGLKYAMQEMSESRLIVY